jgi:hypothetical protein
MITRMSLIILYACVHRSPWYGPMLAPRRQWNENENGTYYLGGRDW